MSSNQSESAIVVQALEKSYGEMPVLWNLDLQVDWGETMVLFGVNGAGKTTLLRILSSHVRPDRGEVIVAGRNLRRQPNAARRRIGVVGHRSFLYSDLTCRENLVYYARLFGLKGYQAKVDEALDRVGLAGMADQRVRALSNGMQRRASIARAILHQPDVLLLDEPEAGLDQESVAKLAELLREWTGGGRSVMMTTHDLELGLSWSHRSGVLRQGRVALLEGDASSRRREIRQVLASSTNFRDAAEGAP